ncbi:HAMP domain-containing sensor histidine kinase [Mangrovibacter sp. SLW1]
MLLPRQLIPRSLRQLVIMAFLLVLVPLLVLARQAWQSLNALSDQAAQTNRNTLVDARRSEAMTSLALEMERSYRQFCVLDDNTLRNVYQTQHSRYLALLDAWNSGLPDSTILQQLRDNLDALSHLQCTNSVPEKRSAQNLEIFADNNASLVQATRAMVYSRGQQLQQEIAERGQYFGWQALILFIVTLVLVMLFTRTIIGPVKAIEAMINRLGEGQFLSSEESVKGPKELQVISQRIVWLSERLAWLESQRHEFLRHISHELKTPLASLREGTELLADEIAGPLNTDQQDIVQILDSSSIQLQKLIEQLLDYNRKIVESAIELLPVELGVLIDQVVSANALPARAKMMHTVIELDEPYCLADPAQLTTALDNLYSNAVHYGNESGSIYLHSARSGQYISIDIANTGTPIPDSEKNMIFEPFFQGRQQRKGAVKGSGLGLSIARDCVHRMQGELSIVEHKKGDVCFRITLPVAKTEVETEHLKNA